MPEQRHEPELAREIVSYYLRNPEARDTLEGLAQWRLMEERLRYTLSRVQAALEWLVERGLVLKTTSAAAPPIFALNRQKQREAERFLSDSRVEDRRPENGEGKT